MVLPESWKKTVGLIFIGLFWALPAGAQFVAARDTAQHVATDTTTIRIRKIVLSGYKKTKEYILRRELPFKEGDRVPVARFTEYLNKAREQLVNTALFIYVRPDVRNWRDGGVDVLFELKERWYIFPIPYFKLIDRNFNQWWVEQDHSLERIDYGLRLVWQNMSGRNDRLRVSLINGYSRQFLFNYENPFANAQLNQGFSVGFVYSKIRQLNFATDSNKQVFYPASTRPGNPFVRKVVQGNVAWLYRNGVKERHMVKLSYTDESIADTIKQLITLQGYGSYYKGGVARSRYPELSYTFQYFDVDNIPYPLRGWMGSVVALNKGLGLSSSMNLWALNVSGGRYAQLFRHTFLSLEGEARLKLPSDQSYSTVHAMGFGDLYLRGLEYYIVDGTFTALGKTTLRQEVGQFNVPTLFRSPAYRSVPFRVFLKTYFDVGYSYLDPPNWSSRLNNRLLYSWGVGLDILSIYDIQIKLEWSFNQLGENGLFLHNDKGF